MVSISTGTSLATFQTSHASSSRLPHVTLSEVEGSGGRLAVAAVQGDGVWTYDLKTLRPTTSFTVPPHTTFSSRPFSYVPTQARAKARSKGSKDQGQDLDQAMDVDEEEEGKEQMQRVTMAGVVPQGKDEASVWVWEGEDGAEKRVIKLKQATPVHSIHCLESTSHPILCVSTSAELSLLDPSFSPLRLPVDDSAPADGGRLLAARVTSSIPEYSRLVLVDSRAKVTVLRINQQNDTPLVERLSDNVLVHMKESRELISAEISEAGIVTAIDNLGIVISRDIRDLRSNLSTKLPRYLKPPTPPCILSVPSRGQPLVLLSASHPSPALLLSTASPDLPAILTISSLSSLSSSGFVSHLAILARPTPSSFVIGFVIYHAHLDGQSGRSIAYTCEVTLPERGIGLNSLIGSQARTAMFFSLDQDSSKHAFGSSEQGPGKIIDEVDLILSASSSAAPGTAQAQATRAEEVWLGWVAKQRESGEQGTVVLPEPAVKKLVNIIFSAALPSSVANGPANGGDEPDATGASQLVLRTGPYAGAIMRDLISWKIVSDIMWKGGVVAAGLLPCCDWGNVTRALRTMPNISSLTVTALLHSALHPRSHSGLPGPPSFAHLYRDILSLPTPASTFRLELRRSLSVEDATRLLSCLVDWAELHVAHRSDYFARWDETSKQDKNPLTPSLERVIAHSSLLLDSHLPSFLSHPPAYPLIERLQTSLEPLIAVQNDFRQLRAPVEAVLTLAKREDRRREERREKKEAMRPVSVFDGPGGKKGQGKAEGQRQAQVQVQVQNTHLPGEAVGKWRVEDIIF